MLWDSTQVKKPWQSGTMSGHWFTLRNCTYLLFLLGRCSIHRVDRFRTHWRRCLMDKVQICKENDTPAAAPGDETKRNRYWDAAAPQWYVTPCTSLKSECRWYLFRFKWVECIPRSKWCRRARRGGASLRLSNCASTYGYFVVGCTGCK